MLDLELLGQGNTQPMRLCSIYESLVGYRLVGHELVSHGLVSHKLVDHRYLILGAQPLRHNLEKDGGAWGHDEGMRSGGAMDLPYGWLIKFLRVRCRANVGSP